jgi:UTP--glucose-1-phosphate uridylyltransferase
MRASPPMHVRKAVITAAAPDQNRLPLQQLVDRRGEDKTALQLIVEETVAAGVEEICLVIRPGDEDAYRSAAGRQLGSLQFVVQQEPRGYADAIHCARQFVADEPFLHLVGDHLYLSETDEPCAKQLIEVASDTGCAVSAVQATRENNLPYFGIVSGPRVPHRDRLYEVEHVVEKPTPTLAEQELVTPGLRAGHYLGFFGMHVLTPEILRLIEGLFGTGSKRKPTLSDALSLLPSRERYVAYQLHGTRCNLGVKYGLLKAQLAIGLSGHDRDMILTEIIDLLAHRTEAMPTR